MQKYTARDQLKPSGAPEPASGSGRPRSRNSIGQGRSTVVRSAILISERGSLGAGLPQPAWRVAPLKRRFTAIPGGRVLKPGLGPVLRCPLMAGFDLFHRGRTEFRTLTATGSSPARGTANEELQTKVAETLSAGTVRDHRVDGLAGGPRADQALPRSANARSDLRRALVEEAFRNIKALPPLVSCVRSCFAVAGACDTAARAPFACRYGPIRYRVTLGLLRTDLQFGTLAYGTRRQARTSQATSSARPVPVGRTRR